MIHSTRIPVWEEVVQRKRAVRDAALPSEWLLRPGQVMDDQLDVMDVPTKCGILSTREIEITEMDAVTLVQELINRRYSSYEVCFSFYL